MCVHTSVYSMCAHMHECMYLQARDVMWCVCVCFRCIITVSIHKGIRKLLSIPKDPLAPLDSAQLVALLSTALVLGNMELILNEQMVQGVLLKTVLPGGKFMLYKCTSKLCYLI